MLVDWFVSFSQIHDVIIYAVVVVATCIEGPVMSFIAGVMVRLDVIPLIPVYVAVMVGDLIGDTVWYWIGRRFGYGFVNRFGKYFSVNEGHYKAIEKAFRKHTSLILFVSKCTMGLGFANVTLMTAGMVKVPYRRFITTNMAGQFIWTAILMSIGYWFSHLYVAVDNLFGRISMIAGLVIVIVLLVRFGKYQWNRWTKRLSA